MNNADESIGYLDVLPDGRFAYDVKLGFNPEHIDRRKCKYDWGINIAEDTSDLGNRKTKEWHDYFIDISDIPPTIFLVGVINSHSGGLGLYIPIDMSLGDFSKYAIIDIKTILEDPATASHKQIHVLRPLINGQIDLEYLNTTGHIKSTRQWNEVMKQKGYIWPSDESDGSIKITKSIQAIVARCRLFHTKLKESSP